MKRFSYLWMAGLMTLGLWACSDDADLDNGGNEINADKVYMSFNLELPTASRSETQEGGGSDANPSVEEGTADENAVSRMDVVLAAIVGEGVNARYKYLDRSSNTIYSNNNYVATFNISTFANYATQTIAVFVFCNYPVNTDYAEILTGTSDLKCSINSIDEIATNQNFWMANSEITTKTLPSLPVLKSYNTPSNPYDLSTVRVERAAARFDFMPAGDGNNTDNKYTLETNGSTPSVKVELTEMALVNMSNQFNYLRTVAAANNEGTEASNTYVICSPETSTNYVIDSDVADKRASNFLPNNFVNYWYTQYSTEKTSLEDGDVINFGSLWSELPSVEKTTISTLGTDDNWESSPATSYKIWRYAVENTLPSKAKQIKSLSTAVAFKGVVTLTDPNDNRFESTISGDNCAYVYNNTLYGTWEKVLAKASELDPSTEAKDLLFKAAVSAVQTAMGGSSSLPPTKAHAVAAGFSVYGINIDSTTGTRSFDAYYYYVNRHNDNGDAAVMGPMEFAVVRNNVYKLKVTDIHQFGHPSDPEGDPDPESPAEPDETGDVYFKVAVQVVPWVVRVNDIEF